MPFEHHPSHVEEERALYVELGEAEYGRENMGRALDWIAAHPGRFAALTARRAMLFWVGELPTRDPRRSGALEPREDPASWVKFGAFFLTGAGALVALLVLRLPRDRKILVTGALLLFGTPYFLSHVSERYRFPVDPLVVLLGAGLLLRVAKPGGPLDTGGGFEDKGTPETPT